MDPLPPCFHFALALQPLHDPCWPSECACSVAQSCLTLHNPMDCSPPGSSVFGIFQAGILEWVAISSSGDLPHPGIEPVSPELQVDSLLLSHPSFKEQVLKEWVQSYKGPSLFLSSNKLFQWHSHSLKRCLKKQVHISWVRKFSSVQSLTQLCPTLQPHELQHARPPCPSPTPGVHPNSCPLCWWCHPAISSSVVPFSCPQSFPASGSFPMSQLFASGGQSIGVSASASVPPMNTQDWFPLGWTGWSSLQSKGLSRVRKLYPWYSHCPANGWCMVVNN